MTRFTDRTAIVTGAIPGIGAELFPLSDEAGWVTGQIVDVDGGQVGRS